MQVGDKLPTLTKDVSLESIIRYAVASGDMNPLHIDPEFGAKTQFGSNIAHGMFLFGYLSELLTIAFGADWASSGRIKSRFRHPTRPGDHVTVTGEVKTVTQENGRMRVRCIVECRIQDGNVVAAGDANLLV
ncbi:MAG: MaoC family dehydratase [Chloroflexi bacterium]|nr:MaoC family dehydratase [Chloroflexota bacterium]